MPKQKKSGRTPEDSTKRYFRSSPITKEKIDCTHEIKNEFFY
jgi:hypothetical protein